MNRKRIEIDKITAGDVGISADGRTAFCRDSKQIAILDLDTGKCRQIFPLADYRGWIYGADISADGKTVVVGTTRPTKNWKKSYYQRTRHEWYDVQKSLEEIGRAQHQNFDWDKLNSPAPLLDIVFDDQAVIHVLDAETGNLINRFDVTGSACLKMTRDSTKVITGSPMQSAVVHYDGDDYGRANQSGVNNDPSLRIWDLETGEYQWGISGQGFAQTTLAISNGAARAVSMGDHGWFMAWDLAAGNIIIRRQSGIYTSDLCISGNGSIALIRTIESIEAWDLLEVSCQSLFPHLATKIGRLALTEKGDRMVASMGSRLFSQNLKESEDIRLSAGSTDGPEIRCLSITPDGQMALTADVQGEVYWWKLGR